MDLTFWFLVSFVPGPKSSGDWAAWVQGVGTGVSVVVAVWAADAPNRREIARQVQSRRQFLQIVGLVARNIYKIGRNLEQASRWDDPDLVRPMHEHWNPADQLRDADSLLNGPIWAWPWPRLRLALSALRELVAGEYQRTPPSSPKSDPITDEDYWFALYSFDTRLSVAYGNVRNAIEDVIHNEPALKFDEL